jgi:hypothetical protein
MHGETVKFIIKVELFFHVEGGKVKGFNKLSTRCIKIRYFIRFGISLEKN